MSAETRIDDPLTDHSYDGIQEYDNPLPGWWSMLFYGSIVFSAFYWIFFHFGAEGRSIHDNYNRKVESIMTLRFGEIGELEPNQETILKYMQEEKWLKVGEVVYTANCVSCHGPDGGGNVGPNLTDDYWKNVKNVEDIAKIISEGAANGAMPAWSNRLSHPNQIVLTAAYIASMRGTNPGNPKKAEGSQIAPWPKLEEKEDESSTDQAPGNSQ